MNKLKLLDLFSGIGGFSLGLESTGFFETIGFVEKDKFCHEVLKKNFPNITIESEVRNVKGDRYAADIITGGFPCQPFSVAGKRRGTDDDRYLWDETIRIIRETKPRWFIGENVEGIINIQEGMVLRQVQDDLEKEGFQVQCLVIPASSIGAWHQRKRVWIIAYSEHNGSHRQERNETIESSNQSKEWVSIGDDKDVSNSNSIRHGRWGSEGCANREWSFLSREQEGGTMGSEAPGCDDIASNSKSISSDERKFRNSKEESREERKIRSKVGRVDSNNATNKEHTTETDTEEQQTWWQTQSRICGIPHGVSFSVDKDRKDRIKSLGNSIVPLIARQLGLAIMKAELDETR